MFYSLNKILVECYSVPGSVLDTEVQGQARQIGSLLCGFYRLMGDIP